MKRLFRWVICSAVVAGAVAVVMKLLRRGEQEPGTAGEVSPAPAAPERDTGTAGSATDAPTEAATWVPPDEGGACPASHPVKTNESSGIFHVPGGLAYDRTTPDRCYRDTQAAEADGFRPAKR